MLSPLLLLIVSPDTLRVPLADTLCPPAAQRMQAKPACDYYVVFIMYIDFKYYVSRYEPLNGAALTVCRLTICNFDEAMEMWDLNYK